MSPPRPRFRRPSGTGRQPTVGPVIAGLPRLSAAPAKPVIRSRLIIITAALLTATGILLLQRRIHHLRAHLRQAQHRASHDLLTGLANREAALTHLDTATVGWVGLLDLDDFKSVNDRYGHHVGDELLIAIAERLRSTVNGSGLVARLAGDEFLIVWDPPLAPPMHQVGPLLERVNAPLVIDGHRLVPAASLGLAQPGPHLQGSGPLIAAADAAMYEAKQASHHGQAVGVGGSQVRVYRSPFPPVPTDRDLTGRRSVRGRPLDVGTPGVASHQEKGPV